VEKVQVEDQEKTAEVANETPAATSEEKVEDEEVKETATQLEEPVITKEEVPVADAMPGLEEQEEDQHEEEGILDKKESHDDQEIKTASPLREPEEEDDTDAGKCVLLERLFRMIRQEGPEQLNAVLSGYFAKLITLLINRKQKKLIPYIFAPGCDFIDCLLRHVYQKSISELLNKLMTINDHEFEEAGQGKEIHAKQIYVIE
jgi:hypothetical protein